MKTIITSILILGSLNLSAQSVVQGTIASTGATLHSDNSGFTLNFTLGQPFGEGAMSESDLVVVQGLQGANAQVIDNQDEEPPTVPSGIENFSESELNVYFDQGTGRVQLSGTDLSELAGTILISDLSGKVLYESKIVDGSLMAPQLNQQAKNVLIITIVSDEQKRLSKKVIF